MQFRYLAVDVATMKIKGEIGFGNVQYGWQYNGSGSFSGDLDKDDPNCTVDMLTPQATYIVVEREPSSGPAVIDNVYLLWRPSKSGESDMTFEGEEVTSVFGQRSINARFAFAATDLFTIAYALVDRAQAGTGGNLGITHGSNTSGRTATVLYNFWDKKRILDALTDLTVLDSGIDFRFQYSWSVANLLKILFIPTYPQRSVFNYVVNPTFESDISNWGPSGNSPQPALARVVSPTHSGSGALRITFGTTAAFSGVQTLTVQNLIIGAQYVASAWVYVQSGPPVQIDIAAGPTGQTSASANWTKISCTFTATDTHHLVQIQSSQATTSGQIAYVDDVSVRLGPDTVNEQEIIFEYGTNIDSYSWATESPSPTVVNTYGDGSENATRFVQATDPILAGQPVRVEAELDKSDVANNSLLADMGTAYLSLHGGFLNRPTIIVDGETLPRLGSYMPGSIAEVRIKDGNYIDFAESLAINSISVTPQQDTAAVAIDFLADFVVVHTPGTIVLGQGPALGTGKLG